MPVKKTPALKAFVITIVIIIPSFFILLGIPVLFNLCLICVGGILVVLYLRNGKRCTHAIRARCVGYMKTSKSRYLNIAYTYEGRSYEQPVLYYEQKHAPEIGQEIGAYINPNKPEEVMLAMYKHHKPRWSDRDKDMDEQTCFGMFILGAVFLAFGIFFVYATMTDGTRFPGTAIGTVVEYESKYAYNGTGAGHYEYRIWVDYTDENGIMHRAYANETPTYKPFDIGDRVVVHYKYDDHSFIQVDGIGEFNFVMVMCFVVAIGFFLNGIRLRILLPKRQYEEIDYY